MTSQFSSWRVWYDCQGRINGKGDGLADLTQSVRRIRGSYDSQPSPAPPDERERGERAKELREMSKYSPAVQEMHNTAQHFVVPVYPALLFALVEGRARRESKSNASHT